MMFSLYAPMPQLASGIPIQSMNSTTMNAVDKGISEIIDGEISMKRLSLNRTVESATPERDRPLNEEPSNNDSNTNSYCVKSSHHSNDYLESYGHVKTNLISNRFGELSVLSPRGPNAEVETEDESYTILKAGIDLQRQQQKIIQQQRAEEKRLQIEQEIRDLIIDPHKPKPHHYATGQKSVHKQHQGDRQQQYTNYRGGGVGWSYGASHQVSPYEYAQPQKSSSRQSHQQQGQSSTAYSGSIYQVQFKFSVKDYIPAPSCPVHMLEIGEFVVTETDNGEDLGVLVGTLSVEQLIERRIAARPTPLDEEESDLGRILRIASAFECAQLPTKHHDEEGVVRMCVQLSQRTYQMPMEVVEADYQFDRQKLTVYYASATRVDFRELIKSLFSMYKTRIWMRKVNAARPFVPVEFASMSLATGTRYYYPYDDHDAAYGFDNRHSHGNQGPPQLEFSAHGSSAFNDGVYRPPSDLYGSGGLGGNEYASSLAPNGGVYYGSAGPSSTNSHFSGYVGGARGALGPPQYAPNGPNGRGGDPSWMSGRGYW